MKRRDFLKMLPAFGIYFGSLQQAIGRELQEIIGNRPSALTISSGKGRREISLPVNWQSGVGYVSADRFAKAFDYNTYLNQQKRKLVIYFPNNKVVVSADNPFVVIDSKVYQMPSACLWSNGGIQVPIAQLIPLTNSYTNTRMEFDKARFILGARKKAFSIAGIDMSSKANGDVIRIRTSRRFRDGEITSNMRNGWLHVDLFGATADVELLKKTKVSGHVRELNVFEFRKLISVALRLRKEPLSREVYQDKSNGDVVVVLRYKEEIAQNEKPKEPEDPRPKKDTASKEDLSIDKQLERERERWLIDTVVIDAGHGGRDPGAIGVGGIREKDLALAVALKLGALVKRKLPDVKVVYTRKDDRFIELRRRTQIANENKAKVFISIHANANRSSRASGFETYLLGEEKGNQARNVMERENSVIKFEDPGSQKHYQGINSILVRMTQAGFQKQSEHLASSVQQNMAKRLRSLNMKNRGVKQAPFWVMVGASMPSILVEMGFITNKHESKILKTASHQQKIAEGIFTGLSRFKKDYESAI